MVKKSFYLTAGMLAMAAPLAMAITGDYPTNHDADQTINAAERSLLGVKLISAVDGTQQIYVNQGKDQLLYHDCTDRAFTATVGETVTPSFNWSGSWMHGFVYLDRGNDGRFDYTYEGEEPGITIIDRGDIMAWSNYGGVTSLGDATSSTNPETPSFTLPDDVTPGLYRMRYKIDWAWMDPAGRPGDAETNNSIVKNRGAIADVMIYVHNDETAFIVNADHGTLTDENGNPYGNLVAGQPFTLMMTPDDGYRIASVSIESGYDFPDAKDITFANPDIAKRVVNIPASEIMDNVFTIPASSTFGKVTLTVNMEVGQDPTLAYYPSTLEGDKAATDGITKLTVNGAEMAVKASTKHFFDDSSALGLPIGQAGTIDIAYTGTATQANLYIDFDQTGAFATEATAAITPGTALSYTVPATVAPAVYRARVEIPGECDVDFLLNAYDAAGGDIIYSLTNGFMSGANNTPFPLTATYGQELTIWPRATLPGFEAEKVIVRHGQNVKGRQYIRGNRQWDEFEVPAGETTTLTADEVNGTIYVMGDFAETETSEWTAIWNEEFDSSEMDLGKWSYHGRMASVWNRFCAVNDECEVVNKFTDGQYQAYAIATPDEFKDTETQQMISGAIYTAGKFFLKGGYIEARVKTRPHTGNFQAFWMMPSNQGAGWPTCGELDIWEQIDNSKVSVHALHCAWRYRTQEDIKATYGQILSPEGTPYNWPYNGAQGQGNNDGALWHTYAIDWDDDHITWFIDGEEIGTAINPHYSYGRWTEEITWPFSKAFYIICNQSVGNGSWAANPDLNFEYRTDFDYVRAYQKKGQLDYFTSAGGQVSGIDEVTVGAIDSDSNAPVEYYNLQGIRMTSGELTPGVYIRRQGRASEKIMVK